MPAWPRDLTGKIYGQLTVLGDAEPRMRERGDKIRRCRCRCVCGKEVVVDQFNLRRNQSCGCMKGEKIQKHNLLFPRRNGTPKIHGATAGGEMTPEYCCWVSMRKRIRNPRPRDMRTYGHLTICERWKDFATFLADMGPRPSPTHSIDRIDNEKGYFPENCRWATKKEQSINRRNVRMLTFNGKTQCVADWARELGVDSRLLYSRIQYRMPLEQILTAARVAPAERRPPGQGNSRRVERSSHESLAP